MTKLRDLIFWRNSAPLSIPTMSGKVIPEEAKITTSDSSLAKLETYVQVDPDSCSRFEETGSVETASVKSLNNSELEPDSTELFRRLVQEACLLRGTEVPGFPVPIKYPDWTNRELIEEGKQFVRKHYFAVVFANLTGIFILLTIKPIQALLIRSTRKVYQKKKEVNNSLLAYLQLFLQLKKWYNLDFAENFSDVQYLRHQMAEKAANFRKFIPPLTQDLKLTEHENLKFLALRYDLLKTQNEISVPELKNMDKIRTTINPDVPMSQYDLAVVQFSLFGLISMFPTTFGIYEKSEEGLRGFVHLWALFGHLLGLQDEFNLALQAQDTQTQEQVFQHVFRFSYRIVDRTGFRLWKSMFLGVGKYFHCFLIPFDSLLYFVTQNVYGLFSDPNKKQAESSFWIIMSIWAKVCYYLHKLCFSVLLRSCVFRSLFNGMTRSLIWTGWFAYVRNKEETSHKTLNVKWSQGNGTEITH